MKNKSVLLLLLALLCPVLMLGQNISVTGKTNRPNALVRLLTYDEMLTCHQTKVAETQSDKDGKFTLKAEIKEITPAQIAINLDRVDIILSPNGKYDLEILIPERNDDESYFEKQLPTIKINSVDDGCLYSQCVAAERLIDNFIYENFNNIYRFGQISLLDTLDNQLHRSLGEIKSNYVKNLIKYRTAAVEMAVNNEKTIKKYFDNQEVQYSLPAYMDVFIELFNGYLNMRYFNSSSLRNEFYSGYDKFMTYLKKNDFLSRNQQLGEIIVMIELRRFYYENKFDKNTILDYIEKIKINSKYLKNKLIAQNLLTQMTDLSYYSQAPSFSLKDKNGNVVKLSDYQDDMVLLQFVDRYSQINEHEFLTLKELQKQWNDTIKVVTIATKEVFDDYVQIFDKQGFKWQLLNLGDNILLLEDYHVKTYPAYVILKRKNRVGMAPAPSPDHYLDYHVRRISKYL